MMLRELSRSCPTEHRIATDYFEGVTAPESMRLIGCEAWLQANFHPGAVSLLREDGFCTPKNDSRQVQSTWPDNGVGWNEAKRYAGSTKKVCGPFVSIRGTDNVVFVNVGKDHPSPDRFTFVIWGDWWLDPIETGTVVCAYGRISLYKGVGQMEFNSPEKLELWR
jgi:hypothetical protein